MLRLHVPPQVRERSLAVRTDAAFDAVPHLRQLAARRDELAVFLLGAMLMPRGGLLRACEIAADAIEF